MLSGIKRALPKRKRAFPRRKGSGPKKFFLGLRPRTPLRFSPPTFWRLAPPLVDGDQSKTRFFFFSTSLTLFLLLYPKNATERPLSPPRFLGIGGFGILVIGSHNQKTWNFQYILVHESRRVKILSNFIKQLFKN